MRKNLYMVMCHKNLDQVMRLVKQLVTAESDVVVHVDSSVEKAEYNAFVQQIETQRNVYITDTRLHGVLDTRSLVDIVFAMVECVKARGLSYQYYCLLSGQDFLIKPIHKINDQLSCAYPTPFIDCTPYDKRNWIYHKFKYTDGLIKFNRFIAQKTTPRHVIRKMLRATSLLAQKVVSCLKMTDYHRLSRAGVVLYGGSAWWILPDVVINLIWDDYKNKTDVTEKLLATYTPEETFFQTIS